jgi:hypothetical protein
MYTIVQGIQLTTAPAKLRFGRASVYREHALGVWCARHVNHELGAFISVAAAELLEVLRGLACVEVHTVRKQILGYMPLAGRAHEAVEALHDLATLKAGGARDFRQLTFH